jgi:hypothetical protein
MAAHARSSDSHAMRGRLEGLRASRFFASVEIEFGHRRGPWQWRGSTRSWGRLFLCISYFAFHTIGRFTRPAALCAFRLSCPVFLLRQVSCCAKCPRGRDKCPGRENVLQSVEDGHGLHARLRRGRKLADDRCALVTFAHAAWTMCGPTRRRWRSCNNVVAGATRGCGVLASAQHHLLT